MPRFSPFDYFFILRPLILIPCWTFLLIGAYLARETSGFTEKIVLGLIIYTCIMGGVYILNQIMDIETDRINKKLFLVSGGYVPLKWAYLEMALLWGMGLILSFQFGTVFIVFIIISLIMGILYSLPPVKLKGKPILDTVSNAVGYGMINFGVGWLLFKTFEWPMFLRFLPYFLTIGAVFINTTIVDIQGDKRAGELTTAVFLGPQISYILSTIVMAGAIITAFMLRDFVCLIPAVVSFPLFCYAAGYSLIKNKTHRSLTITSFRLPGLIFALVTVYLYPFYLLVLLIVFTGMRVYYKNRFGISYPTLVSG